VSKLVFAAKHAGLRVRAKTSRLEIRIMCLREMTSLPVDCCFCELALQKSKKVKQKSLTHYFIHVPFVSPVSPLFHSWTSYFTAVPFFYSASKHVENNYKVWRNQSLIWAMRKNERMHHKNRYIHI
jgi:hypothetical protein